MLNLLWQWLAREPEYIVVWLYSVNVVEKIAMSPQIVCSPSCSKVFDEPNPWITDFKRAQR